MIRNVWVLSPGVIAWLAVGSAALAQSTPKPPPGPACGPTMQFGYFAINVTANVSARAGDNQTGPINESVCSAPQATANGGKNASAADQNSSLDASYTYAFTDRGIAVSSEVLTQVKDPKLGSGMGSANLVALWRDTVMVTSAKMQKLAPDAAMNVNATSADAIRLKVHLVADEIQCTGNTASLFYTTSLIATAVTLVGSAPLGGIGQSASQYTDVGIPRLNVCSLGLTDGTVIALNGYPIFVNLGVQVQAGDDANAGAFGSGDVKTHVAGLRLCFVRPPPPSDVQIKSASGKDYWC